MKLKTNFVHLSIVTCGHLNLINGHVTYNRSPVGGNYPVDTVASFSCNSGYYKSQAGTRTCQETRNWSNQNPTCNRGNKQIKENELICISNKLKIPQ